MSIPRLRSEIRELRNSIVSLHEPMHKVFILGTKNSPTQSEIETYSKAHPHTHVLILTRQSCGQTQYDNLANY